jgi:hypothetical protein
LKDAPSRPPAVEPPRALVKSARRRSARATDARRRRFAGRKVGGEVPVRRREP